MTNESGSETICCCIAVFSPSAEIHMNAIPHPQLYVFHIGHIFLESVCKVSAV